MKVRSPLLIVFEGIDGSGKTTLSRMLVQFLEERNYKTAWFREPGDSRWGQKIRELAHTRDRIPLEEELNYFIEDRKLNVKDNILPALRRGEMVVLDRYYFSTACYQGARGMEMERIIRLNREFAPEPDITIIVDVDVETALKRIKSSRDSQARLFEKEEFLKRVRQNYLSLEDINRHIHIIDGTPPLEAVFDDIKVLPELRPLSGGPA